MSKIILLAVLIVAITIGFVMTKFSFSLSVNKENMTSVELMDQIKRFYSKYMDKTPAQTEIDKYITMYNNGSSIDDIENKIIESKVYELLSKYSGKTEVDFAPSTVSMFVSKFKNPSVTRTQFKTIIAEKTVNDIARRNNMVIPEKIKSDFAKKFATGKIVSYSSLVRIIQEYRPNYFPIKKDLESFTTLTPMNPGVKTIM